MDINLTNQMIAQQAYSAPKAANAQSVKQEEARQVSDDFESFFLFQMLELMDPEVADDPNFGGGTGEAMFNHIKNEHIAEAITDRGGIGLSDTIYDHLLKLQEVD